MRRKPVPSGTKSTTTLVLALAAAVALLGCTATSTEQVDEGRLLVRLDRNSYRAGDTVTVEFVNEGTTLISYSCLAQLDQRILFGWQRAPNFIPECGLGIRRLTAQSTQRVAGFLLPQLAQPGVYRFTWDAIFGERGFVLPGEQRVSPEFEIVEPS